MGDQLPGWQRVLIGCLGGLLAVCTKYIGQDHNYYMMLLDAGQYAKMYNLYIGYAIIGTILLVMGAAVAWLSDENKRIKLAAVAVAAPALVTTWAGGEKKELRVSFIDSAIAQEVGRSTAKEGVSVTQGVKSFFGIGRDDDAKSTSTTVTVGDKNYTLSGPRTKVIIKDAVGGRDEAKVGMDCKVTGPAGGEALTVDCK